MREAFRDASRERRARCRVDTSPHTTQHRRLASSGSVGPRAVARAHRVHARPRPRAALQLEHAVAAIAQPVLDVRAQATPRSSRRAAASTRTRRTPRRSRPTRCAACARCGLSGKSSGGGAAAVVGEHDRLVGPDARDRCRAAAPRRGGARRALRVAARDERRIAGERRGGRRPRARRRRSRATSTVARRSGASLSP